MKTEWVMFNDLSCVHCFDTVPLAKVRPTGLQNPAALTPHVHFLDLAQLGSYSWKCQLKKNCVCVLTLSVGRQEGHLVCEEPVHIQQLTNVLDTNDKSQTDRVTNSLLSSCRQSLYNSLTADIGRKMHGWESLVCRRPSPEYINASVSIIHTYNM